MMETVLLRGKRRLDQWMEVPGVSAAGRGLLWLGGGVLLSGAALWGRMQPLALGLICAVSGWGRLLAALGSSLGYRLFWGQAGIQGAVWAIGTLLLASILPFLGENRRDRLAGGTACLIAASGLFFQYRLGDDTPTLHYLLRICLGGLAAGVSASWTRSRTGQWAVLGLGVLALSGLPRSMGVLGYGAVGALSAAAPLPAAALAGLGADIGRPASISLAGAACCTNLLLRLPLTGDWRRFAAPGLGCLLLMMLQFRLDFPLLLAVTAGGLLGAMIPWNLLTARRGGLGAAQVQLEQTAYVLTFFRRQLLEYGPPPLNEELLLEQLRLNACRDCPLEPGCQEKHQLHSSYITENRDFPCRREERMNWALRETRDQWKRMKQIRSQLWEYRSALVQQYGFLAEALHRLADNLPQRRPGGESHYRVLVSSRTQGREIAEGDRVLAFPGEKCRYYVLLCDGMGTGLGAAEEGRQACGLLKTMLSAGLPPVSALTGLNSQLTILGRGGAVTVDLAEIRLDSGIVRLYKWGACPSYLLTQGRARIVGRAGPPPGMEVEPDCQSQFRVKLNEKAFLIMTSDGIDPAGANYWAASSPGLPPGELAELILRSSGRKEDDATVVVIQLVPSSSE